MSTKHTPGPWSRNIPPATKYPTVFAGRNTHIAALRSDHRVSSQEAEHNINLIVAAPDLLAALRDAANNGLIYWEPNTERGHAAKAQMLARIEAIIAKAEGRP